MNSKLFHSDHLTVSLSHCPHFSHFNLFFKAKIHMGKGQIWHDFLHPALVHARWPQAFAFVAAPSKELPVVNTKKKHLKLLKIKMESGRHSFTTLISILFPRDSYPVSSTDQGLLSRSPRHQSYWALSLALQNQKDFILSWSLLSSKKPKPNEQKIP